MQKRFIQYQDELLSFEANEKYAGIIPSSVYRGFDTITSGIGLAFTINHDLTGEEFTNKDLSTTPKRGIWVTKQGAVIKEDAPISLAILANPNNYERWDVLIGEHIYDELNQGGLEATYTVIPGNNLAEPTGISNTQTILGRIRVPANATGSSGIIWERRAIPQLGGKFPALLAENNRFTGQNSEAHATLTTTIQTFDGISKGTVQGMTNANSFLVNNAANFVIDLLPSRPLGTLISLTFNADVKLAGFSQQLIGATNALIGYSQGYRPLSIFVTDPTTTFTCKAGETATFRMVEVGGAQTKRPHSQFWSLVGLTDASGKAYSSYADVTDLKARMTNAENAIADNALAIGSLSGSLSGHLGNTNNPHNVTKAQVGLSNIPNNVSDQTDLDQSDTLATSKAVKLVNDKATTALNNAMPKGGIIMWSGAIDNIPTGYVLCDGRPSVNGVVIPDLRNKFIRGASDLANAGGLTPDDRGQVAQPSAVGAQGGNNKHQMTIEQMPPHTHEFSYNIPNVQTRQWGDNANNRPFPDGEASRNGTTGSTGGIAGVAQEFNLMPQYYALAFIIKTI